MGLTATKESSALLANLLQLYAYDFSEVVGSDVLDSGTDEVAGVLAARHESR